MFFEKQPADSAELLTIRRAARLLGVSVSAMRRLQQERRIPFFKVGRSVRLAHKDVLAFLSKRRVEAVGQQ